MLKTHDDEVDFTNRAFDKNDRAMYNEKELVNFHSAPLNAQSALLLNHELEIRHIKLQEELKNRDNPLFNKKDLKKKNLKDLNLDDE